jgi:hypothetical protein
MSQKYLPELIAFAQRTIPELEYSFRNASTHYALQEACQKQFGILTYMLHHLIHAATEDEDVGSATPRNASPEAEILGPVRNASPRAVSLPLPHPISQPALAPSAGIDGAPAVDVQPGVTNVIITPQGTRVVAPSGAATVLPPGEHVSLEAASGIPTLPDAPPGVAQVILPPGGGMSPEVLAALGHRS